MVSIPHAYDSVLYFQFYSENDLAVFGRVGDNNYSVWIKLAYFVNLQTRVVCGVEVCIETL